MKLNAVNNKESGNVLSVSGQCVVAQAWLALLVLYVLSTPFPGGLSLHLAFGSFFSFFYPHPSSPFLFPLINQCDMCPGADLPGASLFQTFS